MKKLHVTFTAENDPSQGEDAYVIREVVIKEQRLHWYDKAFRISAFALLIILALETWILFPQKSALSRKHVSTGSQHLLSNGRSLGHAAESVAASSLATEPQESEAKPTERLSTPAAPASSR
jgi:hypothetical protein